MNHRITLLALLLLISAYPVSSQPIISSSTIQYSHDTQVYMNTEGWQELTHVTMTDSYTGSWTISYNAYVDDPGEGEVQLRINGQPYGSANAIDSGMAPTLFSQEFTNININAGDTVEVWGTSYLNYVNVYNFRIMFSYDSSNPTPTPTPIPPQSNTTLYPVAATSTDRDITNDQITVPHTIRLCKTVPTDNWNPNAVPTMNDCINTNTFDLSNYPLNDLPSGQGSTRIAPGEMVLIYSDLHDYSGTGIVSYQFSKVINGISQTPFWVYNETQPLCGGNCQWTYWNHWGYAFTGHYDWEINAPGTYRASIKSQWGNAYWDFEVIDPEPFITVMSDPENAALTMDGISFGHTPMVINGASNGNHTFVMTLSGYQTYTTTRTITGSTEIIVTLTPDNSPTPTPTNSWSVNIHKVGTDWNINACAAEVRGYFYFRAPDNNNHYGTYVDANQCTDFSLPNADMILSGGAGTWTGAIFDANDLSFSKAYMAVIIEDQVIISLLSVPSGANVFLNNLSICTTPCSHYPIVQDLSFKFVKTGYYDLTISGHYSTSATLTANMVLRPNTQQGNNTGTTNNGNTGTSDAYGKLFDDPKIIIGVVFLLLFCVIGYKLAQQTGFTAFFVVGLFFDSYTGLFPGWIMYGIETLVGIGFSLMVLRVFGAIARG